MDELSIKIFRANYYYYIIALGGKGKIANSMQGHGIKGMERTSKKMP
jgi:hypothetical protein